MTDTPNRRKDDARPAVPLQWGEQPDALQALCARYELENQIVQSSARLLGMLGVGAVQLPIKGTDQYVVAGTLSMIAAVLPAVSAAVGEPVLTKAAFEQIAEGWDGCEGEGIHDIGAVLRSDFARLAAPTQAKPVPTPSAALTPDGRAIKWKAEFAMAFWVNKGYRPLYLAAPTQVSAPQAEELTPLDYRAQGREEVLAIILGQSSEDPFSACIGWANSGAPDDEGGTYWDEEKLRALLHIGDKKHNAYDRAEAAYWDALGRKEEAAREMLMVERAPYYKPLNDFLAKHQAWDLMGDLKRATIQAGAPQAGQEAQAVPDLHDAIMNLPDNGGAYEGRERTVYKLGHRDARHAAAELAIGYVPATSSTSGAPAAPDEVRGPWVSVYERLPEATCLASYAPHFRGHNSRVIRAVHFKQYQVQASGDDGESIEYNEADDTDYIKAGWYERIDNWGDFSSVAVCEGIVTHWMPLPAAPDLSPTTATGADHE